MNINYIYLIVIFQVLVSCNLSQKINNDYLPSQTTETITLLGDTLISPKLKEGKSEIKGGVNILYQLDYPSEIIDNMKDIIKNINI